MFLFNLFSNAVLHNIISLYYSTCTECTCFYASSSYIFRQNAYSNSGHSGSRPTEIAWRWTEIVQELWPIWDQWHREESIPAEQRSRGAMLRTALSRLGPVFVKIGQTLSERPDLIGTWAESSTDSCGRSHIGCSFIFIPSLYAHQTFVPWKLWKSATYLILLTICLTRFEWIIPVSLQSEGSLESFSWTCRWFFIKAYLRNYMVHSSLSSFFSHLSPFKTFWCPYGP